MILPISSSSRLRVLFRRHFLVVVVLLLTYLVASSKANENEFNVFHLGNSYTHYNGGVDAMLEELLKESLSSKSVAVDRYSKGGAKLAGHAIDPNVDNFLDPTNTTGQFKSWDWVVLQDQSQVPGFYDEYDFYERRVEPVIDLNQRIEATGANTVLFQTWGRRNGDKGNMHYFPDFLTMQQRLAAGYMMYRDAITSPQRSVLIAPVGYAFEYVYKSVERIGENPVAWGSEFVELYHRDGSHPSEKGSYLAACVIFATITGNDPRNLTSKPVGISEMDRDMLQEYAWYTLSSFQQPGWTSSSGGGNSGNDPSVTITVTHDDYPIETKWEWSNLDNGEIIFQQEYADVEQVSAVVSQTFSNLRINTSYEFSIWDSYEDGICCEYGRGKISIVDNNTNQEIFSHSGNFQSNIAVVISVDENGNLLLDETLIQ